MDYDFVYEAKVILLSHCGQFESYFNALFANLFSVQFKFLALVILFPRFKFKCNRALLVT